MNGNDIKQNSGEGNAAELSAAQQDFLRYAFWLAPNYAKTILSPSTKTDHT